MLPKPQRNFLFPADFATSAWAGDGGVAWPLAALLVFGVLGWAASRWKVAGEESLRDRGGPLKSWFAYLVALLVTAVTMGVRIAHDGPLGSQPDFGIFTFPIMVSAYLGGVRAGLLATAVTFFGASYFLLPPIHNFTVASEVERWQQFSIVVAGVSISVFCELLHRARRRAESATRRHLKAEADQHESEMRYRTLFDYAPEGIAIADLNGRYLEANPTFCQMLGYSREEMKTKSVADVVLPSEVSHIAPAFSEVGSGTDHHREWQFRCKDGSTFAAEVTATQMPDGTVMGIVRDVTERKRADEKLREAVRFSQSTIDALSAHLCVLDATGAILATNRAWNEFAEAHPSAPRAVRRGANYLAVCDTVRGEDGAEGPAFAEGIRAVMSGQSERFALEYPCHSPTEKLWFTAHVTRFPGQGATRTVIAHEDITERKMAEEALLESEARFRTMANAIPQLAWIARGDGFIHWYNDRWYEYTGTTPQEMEGWGWRSVHDPEVLPLVMERWQEALQRGVSLELEFPLRAADGRFRTFLTRVQPWKDAHGKVVQWFGTNTDIEDLKQSEENVRLLNAGLEQRVAERTAQLEEANAGLLASRAELRSLFESLPGLYLVLTRDFTIVAASDAYLKATATAREAILDRNLLEIFPENPGDPAANDVQQLRTSLQRVLERAAPDTMAIQRFDIRNSRGVFEERYWSPVNSPVFGPQREIKYIVHRVEEVTDFVRRKNRQMAEPAELRARLEQMEAEVFMSSQALQATNQQLIAANRGLEIATQHKSEFLAGMSHELRTPLNAILGFTGTLLMKLPGPLNADQEKQLRTVQTSAKHLLSLINDLLDLAKIEAGKRELATEILTAQTVLQEVEATLRPLAEKKGLRFEIEAPATEILLRTDRRALSQILFNLAGNAIKFTGQGSVTLTLDTRVAAKRVYVDFRVIDTGPGIPPELQERLFGLFTQGGQARGTRNMEGSGLGLHLSQNLAGLLGGHLVLESTPHRGSTFKLTLPLLHEEEVAA